MIDWLKMGGHGFYIWASYGMLFLAIAIELIGLRQRRRNAREMIEQATEEATWQ
jgi:heme exporter protein CcmD